MRQLVEGLRKIISSSDMDSTGILRVEALVKEALPRLQKSSVCTQALKPGRYLCYKDHDLGFVIMVLVWGKGDGTPIHDHGTWGVEAVLLNALKVTQYSPSEENPEPLGSFVAGASYVMHNLPPDRDVHRVEHHSGDAARSLHIYGKEMTGNRSFYPGEGFKVCKLECRDLKTEFDFSDLGACAAKKMARAGNL